MECPRASWQRVSSRHDAYCCSVGFPPTPSHPAPPPPIALRTCVNLQLEERALAAEGSWVAACGQGCDGEAVGARADLVVVLGDAPLAVLVVVVASAVWEGGDNAGGQGVVRHVDLGGRGKRWHTARARKQEQRG